jgi:hypothetical protein
LDITQNVDEIFVVESRDIRIKDFPENLAEPHKGASLPPPSWILK